MKLYEVGLTPMGRTIGEDIIDVLTGAVLHVKDGSETDVYTFTKVTIRDAFSDAYSINMDLEFKEKYAYHQYGGSEMIKMIAEYLDKHSLHMNRTIRSIKWSESGMQTMTSLNLDFYLRPAAWDQQGALA